MACANQPIPDVEICREIPFVDAPEGACATTVTHKNRLVSSADWAKERPYLLSLSADAFAKIKTAWLQGCLKMGSSCDVQVDSIQNTVNALDALAKAVIQP